MPRATLIGAALAVALSASGVSAQPWALKYPEPAATSWRVTKDVPYAANDGANLWMDVYRPRQAAGPVPAVIFYSLYWPAEGASQRTAGDWFTSWARLAAAKGLVAILADLRAEPGTGTAGKPSRALGDDFQRLVAHVIAHAGDYGVDPDRIGVFAESGAVWPAMTAIQDPAQQAIKAAVVYYGGAEVETFRRDLPLLWVRAGRDSEAMNARIARLSALAVAQNAPVTLVNHPTGQHGFEGRDDGPLTRDIIDQTLAFFTRTTTADFRAAMKAGAATPAPPR
jgi:dienelactone hydrolase